MTDRPEADRPEADRPEADRAQVDERVEEVLRAADPPLAPLGPTTDYRQLLLAWATRHGLTLDEVLERLAADPEPVGAAWVAKINGDPETREAMAAALARPVSDPPPDEDPIAAD